MAERRADRHSRFLQAGLDLFGTKGYGATSVSDICASAGLVRTQFYSAFTNREKLLTDVYDRIQQSAEAAVVAALARSTGQGNRELASVVMTALVDSIGRDPRRTRICYIEMLGVNDAVEQHRADRRRAWVDFFETMLRKEVGSDYEPPGGYRLASTAVLGAFTEVVSDWSRTPAAERSVPVNAVVETLIAVLSTFVPDLT